MKTRRAFLKLLAKAGAVMGVTAVTPSVALSAIKKPVYGGKAGGGTSAHGVNSITPHVQPSKAGDVYYYEWWEEIDEKIEKAFRKRAVKSIKQLASKGRILRLRVRNLNYHREWRPDRQAYVLAASATLG